MISNQEQAGLDNITKMLYNKIDRKAGGENEGETEIGGRVSTEGKGFLG